MGLDMYLNAKLYLSSYDPKETEISQSVKQLLPEICELPEDQGDIRVKELTVEAGYWRKANAVHNWFVIIDNIGYLQ